MTASAASGGPDDLPPPCRAAPDSPTVRQPDSPTVRQPDSPTVLTLSLFVTDSTPSSVRARTQLRNWLQLSGSNAVRLEVVDVLERPELAEAERIMATPALVRHHPPPRRKIIGDLSDWEALLRALDLGDGGAR
jgi:circadian clock protein KaiB